MLAQLLAQNKAGLLRSASNRGFIDGRSGRDVRLCGTYRYLHEKCKGFPHLSRKEFRARRRAKRAPTRVTSAEGIGRRKASSKRTGEYFHRHAHHTLVCKVLGKCQCPDMKKKRVPEVRKQSPAYEMLEAVKRFTDEHQLVALSGEQVIVAPTQGLGTRFDMLFERRGEGRLVLISWKSTGYCPFGDAVTEVSLEDRVCRRITEQTSSEAIVSREHLAQLVLELHMLRDEHKVDVHEAMIVYLSPFSREYRVVAMDRDSIEGGYQRAWEWINDRRA